MPYGRRTRAARKRNSYTNYARDAAHRHRLRCRSRVTTPAGASGRDELLFSHLVKLYVTPDIYVSFANLRKRLGK